MPIVQSGALNTTALIVPDLYVVIVPPSVTQLNGVPTDVLGIVGTATWGPVGVPTVIGDMADYAAGFGPVMPRTYDMGTATAIAVQQGAQNFRCVRATDGTDTKASVTILSALTLTAKYTGTLGNNIVATVSAGSKANSWRVTITIPGFTPEVFDNIPGTGTTVWANMANAINNGCSALRGPSQIVTASATGTSGAVAAAAHAFAGGTDGVASMTDTLMLGVDTPPYSGMYALQGQGCGVAMLADVTTSTTWATQIAFAVSEGLYIMMTDPPGEALSATGITDAVTNKQTAGVDSPWAKLMFGDWVYWQDTTNNVLRLVSPQAFVAGRLANLSPEQSSLNKPLYGVVGTQKSGVPGTGQQSAYASADLSVLFQNGLDVIANPQPGGAYFGVRGGFNTSSSAAMNGDNYTRLTDYIAATLQAGMGIYVGQVVNAQMFLNIKATLLNFLSGMLSQGLLGSTNGSLPFSVVCDSSNNPPARTALGYVQADVQIQYQAINEKFIVNVEGGQTVTISSSSGTGSAS
jgi:hypothetical protein